MARQLVVTTSLLGKVEPVLVDLIPTVSSVDNHEFPVGPGFGLIIFNSAQAGNVTRQFTLIEVPDRDYGRAQDQVFTLLGGEAWYSGPLSIDGFAQPGRGNLAYLDVNTPDVSPQLNLFSVRLL